MAVWLLHNIAIKLLSVKARVKVKGEAALAGCPAKPIPFSGVGGTQNRRKQLWRGGSTVTHPIRSIVCSQPDHAFPRGNKMKWPKVDPQESFGDMENRLGITMEVERCPADIAGRPSFHELLLQKEPTIDLDQMRARLMRWQIVTSRGSYQWATTSTILGEKLSRSSRRTTQKSKRGCFGSKSSCGREAKSGLQARDFLDHFAALFQDNITVEEAAKHLFECRTHLRRCTVEPLEYMAEKGFVRLDSYSRWCARIPFLFAFRDNPVSKPDFFRTDEGCQAAHCRWANCENGGASLCTHGSGFRDRHRPS